MSIIAAGTTTTTALSSTGNTDGTLQLQVNGTTPSVTLNTLGAVGVGSTPAFGTAGQVLTSAGSTAAPSWTSVTSSQWVTTGSNIYYNTGNVGIGVVPSAWALSGSSALQIKNAGVVGYTNGAYLTANLFFISGGSTKYIADGFASFYSQSFGNHEWYTVASGTAGATFTATQAMTLNASGNLLVGSTSDAGGRFQMTGNYARLTDGAYAGYIGKGSDLVVGAAASDLAVRSDSNLLFSIGSSEKFRIGTSGQLGIGGANYGTSGQVLTSGGSGAAPTWATAGGGAWTYLSTVTASGASTVSVETTFDSTYDQYVIVAPAFTLSGNPTNGELKMQLKIGGSYPASSGYMYASNQTNNSTYSGLHSTNNDAIYLSTRLSDSPSFPNAVMDLVIYVSKPSTTNRYKTVMWQGSQTFGNNPNTMNGVGWYSASTAALTGVRLLFAGGATFSGSFRLYGIKNS